MPPPSTAASSPSKATPRLDERIHESRVDFMTPVALVAGVIILIIAMKSGGAIAAFVDPRSLLIVAGGTLTVTIASFPARDLSAAVRSLRHIGLNTAQTPQAASRTVTGIAQACRKNGPRAAEDTLPALKRRPFLQRAITMSVDALSPEDIEFNLWNEAHALYHRQCRTAAVFRRAGDAAPAMGLIGTIVGLVRMLGELDDPATIAPAMALALLTTLYGAVLGHMLLHPLAARLHRQATTVFETNTIYILGAIAIARGDTPRDLELTINAHLARRDRAHRFTS